MFHLITVTVFYDRLKKKCSILYKVLKEIKEIALFQECTVQYIIGSGILKGAVLGKPKSIKFDSFCLDVVSRNN